MRVTTTRPDPSLLLPADVLEHWRSRVAAVAGETAAQIFADAMIRTLSRTLHVLDDGTVFVITGDIPAMWLRDSATQMLPYLRIAQDVDPLTAGRDRSAPAELPEPRSVRQRLQHRGQRPLPRPGTCPTTRGCGSASTRSTRSASPSCSIRCGRRPRRTDHLDATFLEAARAAVATWTGRRRTRSCPTTASPRRWTHPVLSSRTSDGLGPGRVDACTGYGDHAVLYGNQMAGHFAAAG